MKDSKVKKKIINHKIPKSLKLELKIKLLISLKIYNFNILLLTYTHLI